MIEQFLANRLSRYSSCAPYRAVLSVCTVLKGIVEERDPHPAVYGQLCGAWDALIKVVEADGRGLEV